MAVLSLTGQLALVAILVPSGAGKLTPAGFAAATLAFRQLVGARGARPLVAALAVAELMVAALVAAPTTAAPGTLAAVGLFAGLTGGVAVVLGRRLSVRCACFGARGIRLRPVHLVRNGAMLAVAIGTCLSTLTNPGRPGLPDDAVLAAVLGGLLALVLVRLDDLVSVFVSHPVRT